MICFKRFLLASVCAAAPVLLASAGQAANIQHVLLISIDGMHALDFINCSNGISGVNGGAPYCPRLAKLAQTGVNYLDTSTSKPSDSFPGLMALVTGGSPRSVGARRVPSCVSPLASLTTACTLRPS